ncbi:MAG: bifunctional phosphopantothenoylcysteine decarboxylase/phosphopantothenate--cysteine ligase CoaBC [Nitrospinales bacterium]
MSSPLKKIKIVLGISGGIAVYKAAELVRLLVKDGASVYVVMTKNAKEFVTPLTFQTLSGNPVYHEIFDAETASSMKHIEACESADLLVVAPATANTIGKLANGLADDPLSTLFVAYTGPVMVAPAMNDKMWANPAVQENVKKLQDRDVTIIDPEDGQLACGVVGPGRLAEPENILKKIKERILKKKDLDGLKILVTAGPTREPIDPVRYITNPSSGKTGFAIARQAMERGAEVTLVSGPVNIEPPKNVEYLKCVRGSEMAELVASSLPGCDVVVMTAAVGDFAPKTVSKEKIKKGTKDKVSLELFPTQDILGWIAENKTDQIVVGFAAESQNIIQNALEKLERKKLDLIVANDISSPGLGFQSDSNQVSLIKSESEIETLPKLSKKEIADIILDRIQTMAKNNG